MIRRRRAPVAPFTAEQARVLTEIGSLVEAMPPVSARASTRARLIGERLLGDSLTAAQVAQRLGVSASRVRQRTADRTLYSIRSAQGVRFPRFQFADGATLPGWEVVAPAVPERAHPLAVAHVMTAPTDALLVGREPVSPVDWLTGGADPAAVVDLVADTLQF